MEFVSDAMSEDTKHISVQTRLRVATTEKATVERKSSTANAISVEHKVTRKRIAGTKKKMRAKGPRTGNQTNWSKPTQLWMPIMEIVVSSSCCQ